MTTGRWRQIDDIFQTAAECSCDERAKLLDERCGDDMDLRAEVESLLGCVDKGEHAGAATPVFVGQRGPLTPRGFRAAFRYCLRNTSGRRVSKT